MQIALVDCNDFYASCEAELQSKLSGLALVVLSNNDGCVVAQSPQAKAAVIRMGEPVLRSASSLSSKMFRFLAATTRSMPKGSEAVIARKVEQ